MRATICIQAALVGAFLCGAPGLPPSDLMGASVAEAKDYYTRKRVNGRWVNGRFPKRSSTEAKVQRGKERTKVAESTPAEPALAPAAPRTPQPLPAASSPPTVVPTPQAPQNALLPLQRALEQRARSMAAQEPGTAPNVRSVTYDFDKGRKTIIYLDGTVAEEPLEPVATGQISTRR